MGCLIHFYKRWNFKFQAQILKEEYTYNWGSDRFVLEGYDLRTLAK